VENLNRMSDLICKITGLSKQVVKLDKNFHIYIHGDKKNIEEGSDDKGKFIKLYYNEVR
jgi:hypothetical protein